MISLLFPTHLNFLTMLYSSPKDSTPVILSISHIDIHIRPHHRIPSPLIIYCDLHMCLYRWFKVQMDYVVHLIMVYCFPICLDRVTYYLLLLRIPLYLSFSGPFLHVSIIAETHQLEHTFLYAANYTEKLLYLNTCFMYYIQILVLLQHGL